MAAMKLIHKEFFASYFRNFYMAPLIKQYLYQPLYLKSPLPFCWLTVFSAIFLFLITHNYVSFFLVCSISEDILITILQQHLLRDTVFHVTSYFTEIAKILSRCVIPCVNRKYGVLQSHTGIVCTSISKSQNMQYANINNIRLHKHTRSLFTLFFSYAKTSDRHSFYVKVKEIGFSLLFQRE